MQRRWMVIAEVFFLIGLCAWIGWTLSRSDHRPKHSVDVKVQLPGARDKAYLFAAPDGSLRYRIISDGDGSFEDLTVEQFARRAFDGQRSRSYTQRLLNVSSPFGYLWVAMGLLGQVLFTGRMVVQWLASEKRRASVVPPMFWWMSLIGSTMLLAYFVWRQDPVGILGQAVGWFIYLRNLWWIYSGKPVSR